MALSSVFLLSMDDESTWRMASFSSKAEIAPGDTGLAGVGIGQNTPFNARTF